MARLQVLFLPSEHVGDRTTTPYILIFDQVTSEEIEALADTPGDLGGARAVMALPFTVEVF